MARNTINSYVWLAETIHKAKKISFEEINRRWMDNDMSEGKPLLSEPSINGESLLKRCLVSSSKTNKEVDIVTIFRMLMS